MSDARVPYSGTARRMSMREMGDLHFELVARAIIQGYRIEDETQLRVTAEDVEGLEASGRLLDRLTPYAPEIAEMLKRPPGGKRA